MAKSCSSAERRPALLRSLLLVSCLCHTLLLTDAAAVDRTSDSRCRLYGYIRGFSLSEVNNNGYILDDVFCQGLPQPHAGQPTQCFSKARTVHGNTENWNQCDPGFYLQGNDQMDMICCKPSSHPYTWYDCSDVQVEDNSYEVHCPAGRIVSRTRDRQCGSSVCTSAISCCAIPDEPGPVKNLDDVKARVMDDTQVPLSLLAHFLGFGWCGGCDGRYVGESMEKSDDKWISSTSGSCPNHKKNERLSISYSDFKLLQSKITLSEVTYSELKPFLLSTNHFVNNDTSPKTVTVGQEITREHKVSHTKLTSFTLSHGSEFQVNYKPTFLGGVETSASYSFGYETTEEKTTGTENSEGSTISYASELTLEPCTAVEYNIFVINMKATQYYNATIDVLYSATLESFLRYGGGRDGRYTNFYNKYRGSSEEPSLSYKFGSSQKSLHDDLKEQSRNNKGPWEWKNMEDRYYPSAGTLLDILTDHSRHEFDLQGRFDELIGYEAFIEFQKKTPPAGCQVPKRKKRSASNNERLSTPTNALTTSDLESYTSAGPVDFSRSTTNPVLSFTNLSQTTKGLGSHVTKAGPDPQTTTATHTTQETTSTIKEATSILDETTSTPGETNSTLEETTFTPGETNFIPEETTFTPEVTTSTPEETTFTPEETTSIPEVTTFTPEETTSIPEETTSIPEETTSTPEETTFTPEKTSSILKETSSTPEETASAQKTEETNSTSTTKETSAQTTEEITTTLTTQKTSLTTRKTTPTLATKKTTFRGSQKPTARTESQGTTPPPVMEFQETLVRYIDLETGSFQDIADIDTNEIIGSGEGQEKDKDKEELLYFLPNGDRNPSFNFAKYFVAVGDDKLLVDESETGSSSSSSPVECHLCLILLCVVVVLCGGWLHAM